MLPMIPGESLNGALEMVCFFFTVVGAVISCLVSTRL
jgi:hypothetical protein